MYDKNTLEHDTESRSFTTLSQYRYPKKHKKTKITYKVQL